MSISHKLRVGLLGAILVMGLSAHKVGATNNIISNPSVETMSGTLPSGWKNGVWGSIKASFTAQSGQAQDGQRSLYVNVTSRSSGDAKWYFTPINVTPGAVCSYSEFYKSNVATEVDVEYTNASGGTSYVWIGSAASKTTYTQFTKQFTIPTGAKTMTVYHLIAKKGWLQTDNFSLVCSDPSTTPLPSPTPVPVPTPMPTPNPTPQDSSKFSRPLISVEFDDGWQNAYQNGLPLIESFGLKTTQYIITETPGWSGYMSNTMIQDMLSRGHDIGSHTVSHPHLPTLSNAAISAELKNSDSYIETLTGKANSLFVTPYCESNTVVIAEAKKYYTSLRNCDEDVNRKSNFDVWNIKSVIVLKSTTNAQIQTWIDTAKKENAWLVLVYHEVKPVEDNDWSITPTKLQAQLQLVKQSGVAIVKTADALAELRSQL